MFLSRCGCLAVVLPSWRQVGALARHVAIVASGLITRVRHLRFPGFLFEGAFAWRPAQALSCVCAVAGQQHDLWLVDGRAHRVLRYWPGTALLAFQKASGQTAPPPDHCSWTYISWSEDGTKLCLGCPCAVLVIDLQSDDSPRKDQANLANPGKDGFRAVVSGFIKALLQRFLHHRN